MTRTLYSSVLAGQRYDLHGVVLEFALNGLCRGVVKLAGQQSYLEPQPLSMAHIEAAMAYPALFSVVDEGTVPEPAPAVEVEGTKSTVEEPEPVIEPPAWAPEAVPIPKPRQGRK